MQSRFAGRTRRFFAGQLLAPQGALPRHFALRKASLRAVCCPFHLGEQRSFGTKRNKKEERPSGLFVGPEQFRQFLKEYGTTGVALHFSLCVVWYGGIYIGVSNGLDLSSLVGAQVGSAASNVMVSYVGELHVTTADHLPSL